jgi:hypothetical protein
LICSKVQTRNSYRSVLFLSKHFHCLGYEVLTAVVMKSTIFWEVTWCSLLEIIRRFGGTYRLHLQGRVRRIITAWHLLSLWYLALFIRPWK